MRRSLFEISLYFTHSQHLVKYCTYTFACLAAGECRLAACLSLQSPPQRLQWPCSSSDLSTSPCLYIHTHFPRRSNNSHVSCDKNVQLANAQLQLSAPLIVRPPPKTCDSSRSRWLAGRLVVLSQAPQPTRHPPRLPKTTFWSVQTLPANHPFSHP